MKGMSTLLENLVYSHSKVKGHSVTANSSLDVGDMPVSSWCTLVPEGGNRSISQNGLFFFGYVIIDEVKKHGN